MDTTSQVKLPDNCTFDENDWRLLARHWFPVAISEQIGEAPFGTVLLDQPLVIYRIKEEIVIAPDICPHRGVPLSLGKADGQGVVCPYHGLRFGAQGRCNRIPATPEAKIPEKMHLKTYPCIEKYGLLWTCLDAFGTVGDSTTVPTMPGWDEPQFQQIVCPSIDIGGFAGRQLEGFLDVAHFGWIHTDTFGDPDNTEVPSYTTEDTECGFQADYRSFVGNYPIGSDKRKIQGFEWLRHFEVQLPFTATLTVHFPDHGRLVIMNAASPMSARKTRLFAPIARNFDKHIPVEDVHAFNRRVFEEDRLVVESQKPECLPLDPALEGHILADRSSIAYRRRLRSMGFSQFFSS